MARESSLKGRILITGGCSSWCEKPIPADIDQQVADGGLVQSLAAQLWQIHHNRVVDTADVALVDRLPISAEVNDLAIE